MKVINLFDANNKELWLRQIEKSDWRAGAFLCSLVRNNKFFDTVGEGSRVLLLTNGNELISYCTFAKFDDIQPTDLSPWIGFVYTFPTHRGHRFAGLLFDEVERFAKKENIPEVYLSTNHIGLYEKYGFEFKTILNDIDGNPSRVYVKKIDKMKLIEPTMEYDEQIQAYRQEFLDSGDSMDGCGTLRRFDNSADWIDFCERNSKKETADPDRVAATQYIFVRESDNKIVGMLQLRHYFNNYLEKFGGHIGYSVCPSERRKGYATQMLAAALPECKKLGLEKVLITCNDYNEGSRKTILNNGGVYESTVYEDECEHGYLERYWIDLRSKYA